MEEGDSATKCEEEFEADESGRVSWVGASHVPSCVLGWSIDGCGPIQYTKPLRDKLPTRVAPQDVSQYTPRQIRTKADSLIQLWFPPEDLLYSLVDLYFKRYNVLLPLLHRPTFEAQLAEKLHWRDPSFAAVVLLVCANGSRFSDDTRVMPFYDEDVPPDVREFDAGILFYRK